MMGDLARLGGFEVHLSSLLVEQRNVARSPSRALRRWRRGIRKVSPFRDVPIGGAFRVGRTLYLHPETFERLKAALAR
ncbi:MAG TPA: hypothetical protein VMV33_17340 [Rhodocyclaceae bacterium]|nr:hypothetical protein [Rhodocyclaceae bacterium]